MEEKGKPYRLENLEVWQKARSLGKEVYLISNSGAFSRDFPLRDQIRRAAISVSSNIAEGFGRYNAGEFRNFLSIASGSATEIKSQVYLAQDLAYLSEGEARSLIKGCEEIIRMTAGLRKTRSKLKL